MVAKKMGRPTDSPKLYTIKFRIDEQTSKELEAVTQALQLNKSEVLRLGVHKLFADLK